MHQPLAEEGLLIRWYDEPIDDDVIDKISARRARIAEIIDLDRRRPVGEDRGSAVLGIPGQIDQNIDGVGVDPLGRLAVRRRPEVDKMIKGAGEASADCPSVPQPAAALARRAIGPGFGADQKKSTIRTPS